MPGRESIIPVTVAIRLCPSSCRWRTAVGRAGLVVGHDDLGARALELHVDRDAGDLRAHETLDFLVVGSRPISAQPSTLWWRARLR